MNKQDIVNALYIVIEDLEENPIYPPRNNDITIEYLSERLEKYLSK